MGHQVGDLVGYNVRFDKRVSSSTMIEYLTDGMLLREAILDPDLSDYGIIILDEIHEMSVATDVLLALVKSLMR